jgi:hypothetical protein
MPQLLRGETMTFKSMEKSFENIVAIKHRAHQMGLLRFSNVQLLISLIALIVSVPFMEKHEDGLVIEAVLITLVLLSAVLAVGGRTKTFLVAGVLVGSSVATKWTEQWLPKGTFSISAILTFGFIMMVLFRFILSARKVNSEVLCAAVSNYLLMGLMWAMAYRLVDLTSMNAFSYMGEHLASRYMKNFVPVYYSFTTLCTVGYGDITPCSNIARMLSILEAIAGTFYMTLLIARLVAMYSVSEKPSA